MSQTLPITVDTKKKRSIKNRNNHIIYAVAEVER